MADKKDKGFQSLAEIMRNGPAHLRPPSKTHMRLVEAAAAIQQGQDDDEIAFQHTYFCQTGLPYRQQKERAWFRQNGRVYLRVEAGGTVDPETNQWIDFPLPFGPAARLILIHLDTEAIRNQSPNIELDDSMTAFVKRLQGGRSPNGAELRLFKQQAASISTAVFRMGETSEFKNTPATFQAQGPIVSGLQLWYPKDDRQRVLWPSYVHLSSEYYETLQNHAVPLDYRAVAALAHNALALDIYKWLAQRLCRVPEKTPAFIPWPQVQLQFGMGYNRLRAFRAVFLKTLNIVTTEYRGSKQNVRCDERGVTLHRSNPPIAAKIIGIAR